MFLTQRILVFHDHLSDGYKTIGFDGIVAIKEDLSYQESDFDLIPVKTRIIERKPLFSLDFPTFGFPTFSDICSEPRGGTLVMCAHMHPRHRAMEFQIVRQSFH